MTAPASAAQLTFSFSDPASDGTPIDLTTLDMTFDTTTGAYELAWKATASNPFTGSFRLNANLFNATAEAREANSGFFQDVFNSFALGSTTTTEIVLTGTSGVLTKWLEGDQVAVAGPEPLGLPPGASSFRTEVRKDEDGPDPIFDSFDPAAATIAVTPVPLPAGFAFLAVATIGLGAVASRRKPARAPTA